MRGKQQAASDSYDSPFAMTILPGKAARKTAGKGAARSRKSDSVEEFTPAAATLTPAQLAPPAPNESFAPPYAATDGSFAPAAQMTAQSQAPVAPTNVIDYPAAPGFPVQPQYATAQVGGDYLPATSGSQPQPGNGQPGSPPAGYAPLNFLDDPDREPEHEGRKSRTPLLIAAALVVALAAGGFYEVPKLLNSKKSSAATTTIVLPPKIGSLVKQVPDASVLAAELETLHKSSPAYANVEIGTYGPDASILVIAGMLPKSVVANTTAQQVALIKKLDVGVDQNLAAVPQAAGTGQFWCALLPGGASTNCIVVDSQAIMLLKVNGPNEVANVRRAMLVRGLVEHP